MCNMIAHLINVTTSSLCKDEGVTTWLEPDSENRSLKLILQSHDIRTELHE